MLRTTRNSDVGVSITGWSPGYLVYGVIIDNPSGFWLQLNPTLRYVPPMTFGWRASLNGTLSVDVLAVPGTVAGLASLPTGDPISITLTDTPVSDSAGMYLVAPGLAIGDNINLWRLVLAGMVGIARHYESLPNAALTIQAVASAGFNLGSGTFGIDPTYGRIYLRRLKICRVATTQTINGTGSLTITTVELGRTEPDPPGGMRWVVGNAIALGATVVDVDENYDTSALQGNLATWPVPPALTVTTDIVCPAAGVGVIWTAQIVWNQAGLYGPGNYGQGDP